MRVLLPRSGGEMGPGFRRDADFFSAMRWGGSPDLDRVILDNRVGEELPAHFLDPGARGGRIGIGELEFDQLALTDFADIAESEPLQGVADRLALRVEDTGFQADMDARLHLSATLAATAIPSA